MTEGIDEPGYFEEVVSNQVEYIMTISGGGGGGSISNKNEAVLSNKNEAVLVPLPPSKCNDLLNEMIEIIKGGAKHGKGLIVRWAQQVRLGAKGPGTKSFNDHQNQMKDRRRGLINKAKEYKDDGCGEPPPEVKEWVAKDLRLTVSEWNKNNMPNTFQRELLPNRGPGTVAPIPVPWWRNIRPILPGFPVFVTPSPCLIMPSLCKPEQKG